MREALNYKWRYRADFMDEFLASPIPNAVDIDLPHTNIELPVAYINEKDYQFTSTYQKNLTFTEQQLGYRIFIRFEGAAHQAKVYFNGKLLGTHNCGYTPFEYELTGAKTGDNLLTVVLNSSESLNVPPFGKVIDYLTFGGIYREVSLEFRENNFIRHLYVYGKDLLTNEPKVGFQLQLDSPIAAPVSFTLTNAENSQTFTAEINDKTAEFVFPIDNLKLWGLNEPTLYNIEVNVNGLEPLKTRTGFRQAEFTPHGFYLNGEKINIIGLNRHQSFPYVGYAMPASAQIRDAEIIKKELGCHMVRTSHYPQSIHFLNACDELGLLVMEEIPGWQNIGDDDWKKIAVDTVAEMVLSHCNHPSIVLWGTRINESQDDNPFYRETANMARSLDPYRQVGGVRNIEMVKPNPEAWLEDVYTYNDFCYWPGHPITDVSEVYPVPNIPGMITEHSGHTYPTKSFDNEERRLTHALRHLDIINAMEGEERISGAIGWCAFDYNTHIEFGSGDRICPHGVMDIFRMPKLAAYGYLMQNSKQPVLQTSTNFTIGEYNRALIPEAWIFTNCDAVEVYRNDEFVGKMLPDRNRFPHLAHPPIRMDWFGDLLIRKEGMTTEQSDRCKAIHEVYLRYHLGAEPAEYSDLMSNRNEVEHVIELHNKYIQNWSSQSVVYRIVGIINENPVTEIIRGGEYNTQLRIWADSDSLTQGETYDVVRVCCELTNENGYRLAYAQDALEIDIEGPLELVGPSVQPLVGGVRSFWLKTKRDCFGSALIKVKCGEHIQSVVLTVNGKTLD